MLHVVLACVLLAGSAHARLYGNDTDVVDLDISNFNAYVCRVVGVHPQFIKIKAIDCC